MRCIQWAKKPFQCLVTSPQTLNRKLKEIDKIVEILWLVDTHRISNRSENDVLSLNRSGDIVNLIKSIH